MTLFEVYHVLDSEDEQAYDDIVELASVITLLDQNGQWHKAKKGLDINETHIDISFCAHTIYKDDLMIVNDALDDERFFL